jgi:hypothetical protein
LIDSKIEKAKMSLFTHFLSLGYSLYKLFIKQVHMDGVEVKQKKNGKEKKKKSRRNTTKFLLSESSLC